jgi:hypothetical protein
VTPGVHFYTLNLEKSIRLILEVLAPSNHYTCRFYECMYVLFPFSIYMVVGCVHPSLADTSIP